MKKPRLEHFLHQKKIKLYSRERFVRRTSRRNPLVNVDYGILLDRERKCKKGLFSLLKKAVDHHGLKVVFVMVSWWGRGDEARWTGSHLLSTLRRFQKEGLCDIYLGYQEGEAGPSSLCRWCRRVRIPVLDVDRYRVVSRDTGEEVIGKKVPGKAENVVKCIKWIERAVAEQGFPPKKVLVLFVDDDYTQYHWLNYFLLFAPWVLSFARKTGDREIDEVVGKIKKVGFIKSGSPRIILPYELQEQIVSGKRRPLDFLGVCRAVIDIARSHGRVRTGVQQEEVEELAARLQAIGRRGQVYAPRSRASFLGERLNSRLERIWGEYIYRGGRVTQRLEGIFRHLIHKSHCRWLRQFTFLLHGDQGAPLDAWLEYSPFGGYALEISLLMEAVFDKEFEGRQVLNVIGLPHSHQRSKDLDIWYMLDNILMAFDLLRVLYKDLSVRTFLSIYGYDRHLPMLDRYGNVIKHHPQYGSLRIYPPLKTLALEG